MNGTGRKWMVFFCFGYDSLGIKAFLQMLGDKKQYFKDDQN